MSFFVLFVPSSVRFSVLSFVGLSFFPFSIQLLLSEKNVNLQCRCVDELMHVMKKSI